MTRHIFHELMQKLTFNKRRKKEGRQMKVIAFSLSPTNSGSFFARAVEEGRPIFYVSIENIEKPWPLTRYYAWDFP